ncbi:hypothetical protein AVEN_179932-1 [Araneus ventricosus]|uniref:Uncharacterized protein n=1 Tax=Araneus ventricosus TaxID=182803 RepID=A0A4Y2IBM8_ARAVE|nr:hypothetical protein AVEN_179932-1 [Araneus ventricosus]
MTTDIITHWPTFDPQNGCNSPWRGCHKSLVDGWIQIVPYVHAAVTQFLDIPTWWLSSELPFHDIPNLLYRIKIRQDRFPGHYLKFISMILEPLHHNSSLVTWSVILLEDSISSWEGRRHIRLKLVCNDVHIVCRFHSVFYRKHGSQTRP